MIMTPMKKTYFEQVPLKAIKKIVEENDRQERIRSGEKPPESKKKGWEADLLETTSANAGGVGT
jgi:hypothetical protein